MIYLRYVSASGVPFEEPTQTLVHAVRLAVYLRNTSGATEFEAVDEMGLEACSPRMWDEMVGSAILMGPN